MGNDKSHSSRVLDGAAITTVAAVTQGIGQILLLAVLARHISQEGFGLVTATLVVIGLGRQFTEALIRPVIIQREHLSVQDIGTASLISWCFAFCAVMLLFFFAPQIGNVLSEPDIVPIIKALSFIFVIQAPSLVAEGLLYRELKYSSIAFAEMMSFLFGYTLVGVVLALEGFGVWALVWAYLAQVGVKCIFLIWQKPKTLIIAFHFRTFRHIIWMSGGFSVAKVLGYIATQIDYLVVAATMNSAAVGIYGRAYQLVGMPSMLIGQVLERIMFPIYSRLQNDRQKAKDYYGNAVALSSTIMAPMSVLFVVLGPEIVHLILGPDWSETVLPLQILSCTIIFRMGYKVNDPLTKATGLVYQRAFILAIYACAVAAGAYMGSWWGLPGVSVGVSLAIVLNFFLMAQLTLNWLKVSWRWFSLKHMRAGVLVLFYFPLLQGTSSLLHYFEVGYFGVLFGVLTILFISVLLQVIIWPSHVFSSDVRWFFRILALRVQPQRKSKPSLDKRNEGVVVELDGLTKGERTSIPNIIVNKLSNEGIPSSEVLKPLKQYKSMVVYYLHCLNLVCHALKRSPRATLYEVLMIIGSETHIPHNLVTNLISSIAYRELVSRAQFKRGIHLLVREPEKPFSNCFEPDIYLNMSESEEESGLRVQRIAMLLKSSWHTRNVEI
ncbi:lipopolysaccharide biosynthesis protein [uncultured Vibrio sp.]|uniref:lipopolysaccharide biosynthesis protein n=1 Tax=uncultured Vibrio sp. TaxID=114054 RepID=UPI002AAB6126|nr:lipopolysaccharide biosynthesis protein [uncultured Vibrio sp.]